MCLELQSLGLYILASLKRYSFYSTEAGIKYFVLGSIASCFLLLGISLVYGFLGTTNFVDLIFFKDIYIYQEYFFILQIGFFFICFAFIFKLGGFPFHFWVPDIYVGVPSVITAFFSILPKFVLISIFFRVCGLLSSIYLSWLSIFIITGLFSIGFGVLGAFFQVSLKRLMAFGAVNHIGFIFVSLSLNSIEGFSSSFFYILVYMFLSLGFFFCFLHMRFFESNTLIKSIYELNSVYVVYPVFGSMFSLLFFSFAGIPPLVGFFSKFYILLGLVNEMAIFLSFFIILFSLISAFYYIRLIKISFFEKAFFYPFFKPIEKNSAYILAFITSLNTFFLVFLGPFFIFCQNVILLWLL
jgi:NADH-quinone oxidoreductase subunit N